MKAFGACGMLPTVLALSLRILERKRRLYQFLSHARDVAFYSTTHRIVSRYGDTAFSTLQVLAYSASWEG